MAQSQGVRGGLLYIHCQCVGLNDDICLLSLSLAGIIQDVGFEKYLLNAAQNAQNNYFLFHDNFHFC